MITGINELKALAKFIACKCRCKFDGRKCSSDELWNNKCQCNCTKRNVCEKDYVRNPSTCNCENGKYLTSIMDNSAIICDEVIESQKLQGNKMRNRELIQRNKLQKKLFQQILRKRKQPGIE